ncbi:uncharacterized protein LOC111519316 isoform X2 [Drosophila willistoni]|uniref:uncharacterized protein LOC111519316 isoform X2 n=1 Tax=Drosophila willistoni TaxID=7260 RepID=UPI000C26D060|nr:uncharacterized protein LOC111519316 isoform X2 [Drosophila willistoni]
MSKQQLPENTNPSGGVNNGPNIQAIPVVVQPECPNIAINVVVDPVNGQPASVNYVEWWVPSEPQYVDPNAPVVHSFMFWRQPDGSYDMITLEEPFTEQEIAVREILMEDGPLIVLTGSNGEIYYNPEDTVTLDIDDDARVFLIDPGDSECCGQVIDQMVGIEQTAPLTNGAVSTANPNNVQTQNVQGAAENSSDDDNPLEVVNRSPENKKRCYGLNRNFRYP